MTDTLKILHSSDWHLGRTLYGRRRHEEFAAFLDWLLVQLRQEKIDVLLLAGDIFDNSTPGAQAQSLYYNFLHRAASICRHIVIVAGNHDSPAFLEAPSVLLKSMNIHIIGNLPENIEDVVLTLADAQGRPELLVCALPYLRDKDLRLAEFAESDEDKDRKLLEGMADRYARASATALAKQAAILAEHGRKPPIVATGHLFAAGGQTVEGDGVRELYVGSLSRVRADIFHPAIDYLALGHLHIPQKLGGDESRRYSGSPLPMSFGECRQQKSLCLVEFTRAGAAPNATGAPDTPDATGVSNATATADATDVSSVAGAVSATGTTDATGGQHAPEAPASSPLPPNSHMTVRTIPVPVFQRLEQISGGWAEISARILELGGSGESIWLEVAYEGAELPGNLRERLDELTHGSALEILRTRNSRASNLVMEQMKQDETLDDLSLEEVFERCLAARQVPEGQKPGLLAAYREITVSLYEKEQEGGA